MDVSEIYGQRLEKLLNTAYAEEMGYFNKPLTIKATELRTIRGQNKLVVLFEEIPELLVLNKTNALVLAEAFGNDTDAWNGKKIMLQKIKRTFQGKLVDAITVVPYIQPEKPAKSKK